MKARLLPFTCVAILIAIWQIAVSLQPASLIPGPLAVVAGIVELAQKGLLVKYVVASLFRVTWGYVSAAVLAVWLVFLLGCYKRGEKSNESPIQTFRQIRLVSCRVGVEFWG